MVFSLASNFEFSTASISTTCDPVTLAIDAYPERTIRGHVDSVQPRSGTALSLLPAENATGNYVKIVQRVPVKLIMDNPRRGLRVGWRRWRNGLTVTSVITAFKSLDANEI
jgi:membrane fusion protein (multidrug efflux system)